MHQAEFKQKVLIHKNEMYRFALTYIKDSDDAKDVVQDVMMKLWETRFELVLKDNLKAWCMALTRNKALDALKRVGRKKKAQLDTVGLRLVSSTNTPAEAAAQTEEINHIHTILETLSEKQRMVFQLRDVEGYSYLEISETLRMDMSQVKVNIFRARKNIKLNLEKLHSYGFKQN